MPRPSAVAREPAVNAREEAPSRTEEALKRELARANWALHSLRERAAARAGQLEEELATVRAERDEARARAEAGEGEASRAAEREGEMEGRVRALRAENEELRGKVEEARGRIGEARGAIAALADTLRRRNVELEAARTQAVEMRGRAQVAEAAAAEAVQARAHAEEEAGALREQKDKSEQERKLWMDIAQDQEGHTGVLRAEIRKLEGRLHLRDGQRVEQEVLMRRVVELDARLDESERARRRSEMVARQLQKTTFRLRAERDELVAKSGPVSAPLPELARPVEPTVRRVEHEEQLANSPAPEVAAQPAEQTVKPAAEPSIEVQPRQAAEAVEDVPVVQVRRAAPEQETAETKPLSPEDNHLYAGRRSKQDSLFEQLLTAERDVGTRESMFRGSEVYDQVVAGLQARWSGFVNSILPQTEAKAEASGEQAVEAVAAEAVAAEAAVEQPPATVETAAPALEAAAAEPIKAPEAVNVAQAPEVEATTVADAAAEQDEPQPGFFTRLARMFGPAQDLSADISAEQTATTPQVAREAIAATLAMEEMRLREEAVDFGRRRQVIEAKSEAKLRPRINAVADENRRLWKTLTAAAVIGRHSRFWKLHVEPRVPPGMAPIVSAAAALRAEVPYKMTAAEELAKVEADNKWLREAWVARPSAAHRILVSSFLSPLSVESIELRNGVGQVVSAEPVAPKKTLQLDFVKHKVAAVTRTVPAKLSEDRKFDFVKHRIDLRSREETTAAEPRTDAEVTGTIETAMDRMLDTEIRAEAATRRGKGGEKKVDASNDVLLNDHAFEALLPTAAAKDEPIRIAETEKREPAQPTTRTGRRIRIPMIYKPFGAAGASPLAPALSRELRSPASEAASAANQPVGHQDKMSASASSRASASSSRCTSRRSSMSRSSVRASDLANQLLQSDGIAADSTMGAALVPILRQIAGSPPPSHVQASEDLAASENIELLRDRMEAARSRVTDAARFIARRRRDAAQLSEVVRSYTKIWDDVEAERRQIRNDIANSTLEMVESQMLQFGSGTSSVSSVASSVGSNADRERRLAELDDIEKQAASLRAVAHRVLRAVEEELVDWTSFQTDADAALARETVTLGAAVRTELARLNQSSETMRIMIPEVDHLPRRLELSNAVAANEARARVLRGYLDEIENAAASRPGSPKSISGDSFTDLESDLADSFENVAAGQSAIVGSEGDEADESRSFFMLRSSLSSRMPSHGSSQGI
ncbi:hypothetical protein DFJ74DRAFT_696014 [Hyaloraphidium curvatum]|nr:hypothetical protein DFJ74DRAFT_696014 [Hyaloraphidium curvatum]